MVKTYIAQSASKNHDWNFSVDDTGNVTKMMIRAEINYGSMGRMEEIDIWGLLTDDQKVAAQAAYDKVAQIFNNEFLE